MFKISDTFLFCRRCHHIAPLWIVSRRRRKGWGWTRLFIKTPEGGREASSPYFELMRSFHGGTSHFMEPLSELVTPQLLPENMLRVVTGGARRRIFSKIQEHGSQNQGKVTSSKSYSEAAEGFYCSLSINWAARCRRRDPPPDFLITELVANRLPLDNLPRENRFLNTNRTKHTQKLLANRPRENR